MKWVVGSNINRPKIFNTKEDAIEYAKELAVQNNIPINQQELELTWKLTNGIVTVSITRMFAD